MVPGIAEREIRLHASRRQDWLQAASGRSARAVSAQHAETSTAIVSAIMRVRHAISGMVSREAASQPRPELAPIRLETARR